MNSGRPVWHASISRANSTGTTILCTPQWGEGVWREARRRIDRALSGVGEGPAIELAAGVCLHARRALAPDEIARLSPEWLAIPARDEFVPDKGMEIRL